MVKELFNPIETAVGHLKGRDAIYLERFEYDPHGFLRLTGEINGALASKPVNGFVRYSLTFSKVLAFKVVDLDSAPVKGSSSFNEVVNSEWGKTLGGKITPAHKHYWIQTYDDVIEVMATKFNLSLDAVKRVTI